MRKFAAALFLGLSFGSAGAAAPIDQYAVSPLSKSGFPKAHAAWGDTGFARINKAMESAAVAASLSPGCNRVEMVSYSESRSSAPDKIVVFADCANRERFYFTESQALAGAAGSSQSQLAKALTKQQAIDLCRDAAQASTVHPQSFKPSVFGISATSGQTTGNWSVVMPFKAKNSFGAELKQTARCVIPPGGTPEISFE